MRVFFTSIVVILLTAFSGCGDSTENAHERGGFQIPVETVVVSAREVEDKLSAVGSLEANEFVELKSEVEGRVQEILFQEGTAVAKGEVLIKLGDVKLRAALESAEAQLVKAQNSLDRYNKLLNQKTISPQEFDDVRAEYMSVNADVTLAREQLSDATIRAPFKGYASERLVSPGDYVEKGNHLVTIVQLEPMKVDFSVPERFFTKLQVGQTVLVQPAAISDREFIGIVYFVDPRVDPLTRTVKVKAQIPNTDLALRPGQFATVKLVVGKRSNAVVIPEQSIVPQIDKVTAYVVVDGMARRREITLGTRLAGQVEILTGINAGEEVVVSGQQKLHDQTPVRALQPGS